MKIRKRILSAIFVLAMLMNLLSVNVLATGTHTVTIESETSGHTYQAYKVFAGIYSTKEDGKTKVLSNIEWGNGVNDADLLSALKSDSTYGSKFTDCSTAASVAEVITGIPDADFADAFAKIVAQHLATTHTDSVAPTGSAAPFIYTISGLSDGYYFINESALGTDVDNAYTRYILQVVADVTVEAKTDSPAIAKKVLENNDAAYKDTWNDAADYSIGDNVPFRIVGLVPDMSNYETYYYKITDTLSAGLSLNSDSVKVYYATGSDMYSVETNTNTGAGGSVLDSSTYTKTPATDGFTITFNDLKSTTGVSDNGYIVVEYTAALNSGAVIGNNGNPNEVYLNYSNNPNNSGAGNNEKGQTPKDEVVVYTFRLPVKKVDGKDAALTGATFALFNNLDAAKAAVKDPTQLTNALKFTGSAGFYTLSSTGSSELAGDSNGQYSINGLDQGTYYLVEIKEPTGYNRLSEPKTVILDPVYHDGSKTSAYVDGHITAGDQLIRVDVNNADVVKVINQSGSVLPSTGGMGTKIFTVVGIILMLGASVLFVVKRKMSSQKG